MTSHQLTLPAESASRVAPRSLTFIENATVLIDVGGVTVLTDPTFIH